MPCSNAAVLCWTLKRAVAVFQHSSAPLDTGQSSCRAPTQQCYIGHWTEKLPCSKAEVLCWTLDRGVAVFQHSSALLDTEQSSCHVPKQQCSVGHWGHWMCMFPKSHINGNIKISSHSLTTAHTNCPHFNTLSCPLACLYQDERALHGNL